MKRIAFSIACISLATNLIGCADRTAQKVPSRGEVASVKQLLGDWDFSNAPMCSALDGLKAAINVAKVWDSDAELYEIFCGSLMCDKAGPIATSWVYIYSSNFKTELLAVAVAKQGAIASGFIADTKPTATIPISEIRSRLKKDTTNPFWHLRAVIDYQVLEDPLLAVWVFAKVVRWSKDKEILPSLSWTDATTGKELKYPDIDLATTDCTGIRLGESMSLATTILDRRSEPLDHVYGTTTVRMRGASLDKEMSFAGSSACVGEKGLKGASNGDTDTIKRNGFLIWNMVENHFGAFFWDIGDSGLLEFYFPRSQSLKSAQNGSTTGSRNSIAVSEKDSRQLSKAVEPASKSNRITVGAYTIEVPTDWKSFSEAESSEFKRQYRAQSEEIYRQYSGTNDQAKSVEIAAFWISGEDGTFIFGSFTVPPQSDLLALLKSQAADKAEWGVREGYIRKYLGLVSIDDEQFNGFYTKAIGKDGEVQVSAGLEHKKLKNTMVQLTLLCPKPWDEVKATDTLIALLKSVTFNNK